MTAKRFVRIVFCTVSMYLATHAVVFLLFPLALVLILVNPRTAPWIKVHFATLLLRLIGKRVDVAGLANVKPGKGYLVIANYPSFHTGFVLMGLFPEAFIVIHDFASRIPVLRHFLTRLGAIYANPKGKGPLKTVRAANRTLTECPERSLIILPEGRRSSDGTLHPFRRGFVYILKHSSLDLLPVTLSGFYQLKPVNRFYLDPDADLRITIHQPIGNGSIRGMSDQEVANMAVALIKGQYKP